MREQPQFVRRWLGQRERSEKLSLGDFGFVRATLEADIFYTKIGYTIKITSCKIDLFGRSVEFLHRLTPDAKERMEDAMLSDVSSDEKS